MRVVLWLLFISPSLSAVLDHVRDHVRDPDHFEDSLDHLDHISEGRARRSINTGLSYDQDHFSDHDHDHVAPDHDEESVRRVRRSAGAARFASETRPDQDRREVHDLRRDHRHTLSVGHLDFDADHMGVEGSDSSELIRARRSIEERLDAGLDDSVSRAKRSVVGMDADIITLLAMKEVEESRDSNVDMPEDEGNDVAEPEPEPSEDLNRPKRHAIYSDFNRHHGGNYANGYFDLQRSPYTYESAHGNGHRSYGSRYRPYAYTHRHKRSVDSDLSVGDTDSFRAAAVFDDAALGAALSGESLSESRLRKREVNSEPSGGADAAAAFDGAAISGSRSKRSIRAHGYRRHNYQPYRRRTYQPYRNYYDGNHRYGDRLGVSGHGFGYGSGYGYGYSPRW